MNKNFVFLFLALLPFFIGTFSGCSKNESDNKTSENNTGDKFSIKYPLPKTTDSLLVLLKKIPNDTNKVNVLNAIAWNLGYKNPDTSLTLSTEALHLSENLIKQSKEGTDLSLTEKIGLGQSYHQIGWFYYLKGDYLVSLQNFQLAIDIWEDLKKIGSPKYASRIENLNAKSLGNCGSVYKEQGDYAKALGSYLKALKTFELLGDKTRISIVTSNVGIIYMEQNDYTKALDYYFKALEMDQELGRKNGIVANLSNISVVYRNQLNFAKALEINLQALKITEEIWDKNGMASILGNIGADYQSLGNFSKSMDYYFQALKLEEQLGDKNKIALALGNIGLLYSKTGKFRESFVFLYRALGLADSTGVIRNVKTQYESLSTLYELSTIPLLDSLGGKMLNKEEMRLRALHYFKRYMNLRDTLFSQESKKQLVRKEMNFEFEKKEATTKAENEKKEALAKGKLQEKEKERNYFIAGFALVLLLAGFIFRGYRQKQKANEIIAHQKLLVEEKQKEILDSIHYAKRIQQSLLPTEKYILKNFNRLRKI